MGHRITATERVDGADFKVTLEKGGDGQYHEIDRRPLPAGIVARTIRAPLRFAGWLLRWPRLICGWPLRALRGQWGNAACWLERTWADTNPALDVVPAAGDASLPTDEQLKGVGLSDDAIARLRKNPASFPHTLRKFGFNFGRVRGTGLAGRAVGSVHFIRTMDPAAQRR